MYKQNTLWTVDCGQLNKSVCPSVELVIFDLGGTHLVSVCVCVCACVCVVVEYVASM